MFNYYNRVKTLEKCDAFDFIKMVLESNDIITNQSHRLFALGWLMWYRKFKILGTEKSAKRYMKNFINEIAQIR